jgi:hypothetical protein
MRALDFAQPDERVRLALAVSVRLLQTDRCGFPSAVVGKPMRISDGHRPFR